MAIRNVHLIQDVDGDSGGALATYRFGVAVTPANAENEPRCVAGLPRQLDPTSAGGIVTSKTVELREGRFNITAALNATDTNFAPSRRSPWTTRLCLAMRGPR